MHPKPEQRERRGFAALPGAYFRFVAMNAAFFAGYSLHTIFVNTFLFRTGSELRIVCLYNAVNFAFSILGQFLGLRLLRRHKPPTLSVAGTVLYTLSYLCILLLQERAVDWLVALAFMNGVGAALYYLAYHSYTKVYLGESQRQYGLSLLGIVQQIIGLTVPTAAGFVTARGMSGYIAIFIAAVLLAGTSVVLACTLPGAPVGGEKNALWRMVRDLVPRSRATRLFWAANFFSGVCRGSFMFLLSLVLLILTDNEAVVGLSSSGAALLGILCYYLIRRTLRRQDTVKQMYFAGIVTVLMTAVIPIWFCAATVAAFSVARGALDHLSENGSVFAIYDEMEVVRAAGHTNEYVVTAYRETALNLGRSAGIVVYMLAPQDPHSAAVVMAFMAAGSLVSTEIFRRVFRAAAEEREAMAAAE